jgi:hypothetical protein
LTDEPHDIFDDEGPKTTEGVSPEAPEREGPARDESGRFAPKDKGEEQPSAAPAEPEPGAPPAPAEKSRDVPITALLDERDKRQAAERRLQELERALQQQRSQQQAPAIPDPVEDADGFLAATQQQFTQALTAERLNISHFYARREYGEEAVEEMMQFMNGQPREVSAQFLSAPSPVHAAVEWFRRHKAAQEVGDPNEYRERLRAELRAELEAEMKVAPSSRSVSRSLAEAPSSGGAPPPASGDPLFN